VPRIAVVKGRCFAGNAVNAGCSDLIVATQDASIGMGGPAMIAGGGLGDVDPDDVGPIEMQAPNGVVDVVAADEAEAVAVAKQLLGYFQGSVDAFTACDQNRLRDLVPERERRAYKVAPIVETLCDEGSVTFLRERFAPEMVTAFGRIEGRPVGVIANNTMAMAGAVTAGASDKAARFLQLCDAFGLPVISLVDTPGYMVGPRAEANTSRALPPISAETMTLASATTASGSEVVEDILLAHVTALALRGDLVAQPQEELATYVVTQARLCPGKEEPGRAALAGDENHIVRAEHLARTITEVTHRHNLHVATIVAT